MKARLSPVTILRDARFQRAPQDEGENAYVAVGLGRSTAVLHACGRTGARDSGVLCIPPKGSGVGAQHCRYPEYQGNGGVVTPVLQTDRASLDRRLLRGNSSIGAACTPARTL